MQGDRKQVALVANYDGFYLDPMVSDAYFSMITYMQNRYYSSASRYTTSAFMRLKLGAGLAERNLAPHVFETWPEAQAFSAAQQRLVIRSRFFLRDHLQLKHRLHLTCAIA